MQHVFTKYTLDITLYMGACVCVCVCVHARLGYVCGILNFIASVY